MYTALPAIRDRREHPAPGSAGLGQPWPVLWSGGSVLHLLTIQDTRGIVGVLCGAERSAASQGRAGAGRRGAMGGRSMALSSCCAGRTARLGWAVLCWANLCWANLCWANLGWAEWVGARSGEGQGVVGWGMAVRGTTWAVGPGTMVHGEWPFK